MMKIKLITVGKLKEKEFTLLSSEYEKRLSGLCSFSVCEIEPVKTGNKVLKAEITSALKKEGDLILKEIPKGAYVFAMCIEGRELSSEELSKRLETLAIEGRGEAVFIIGSSYGLSPEVKSRADFKLSMSKMTFPHKLARIMLTEQLYRAFSISGNGKYHK